MTDKSFVTLAIASIVFALPTIALAQYYYPYAMPVNYGYHNFSPVTYINTSPYVSVNAPQYASASYAYSYPSYNYSYPSYQYSYPTYSYSYPSYQNYWYDSYSYNYSSGNSYSYDYWWNDPNDYCYSGYGCYPMQVDDPHQWIYDSWGGSWY